MSGVSKTWCMWDYVITIFGYSYLKQMIDQYAQLEMQFVMTNLINIQVIVIT